MNVDELRVFGSSKDQKYHCTQVVLALATNTAEVKTLIDCVQTWANKLQIGKVRFVADRALCSKANLALLEWHELTYVVAMPLRRSLKALEQAHPSA